MVVLINKVDVARSSTLTKADIGMYAIMSNGCFIAFFTDKADAEECEKLLTWQAICYMVIVSVWSELKKELVMEEIDIQFKKLLKRNKLFTVLWFVYGFCGLVAAGWFIIAIKLIGG